MSVNYENAKVVYKSGNVQIVSESGTYYVLVDTMCIATVDTFEKALTEATNNQDGRNLLLG